MTAVGEIVARVERLEATMRRRKEPSVPTYASNASFCAEVFGTELSPIYRMRQMPTGADLPEAERDYVTDAHVQTLAGTC